MLFSELFDTGITFETFVQEDGDISGEKLVEMYEGIVLEEERTKEIRGITRPVNILAFAEIWCPDCIINLPALQKIKDLNKKVNFKIVARDGNESYMQAYELGGKAKIPTFIVFDENFKEELGHFIEIPKTLRNTIMASTQAERIVIKRKYNKGEYIRDTIQELLEIINGKGR